MQLRQSIVLVLLQACRVFSSMHKNAYWSDEVIRARHKPREPLPFDSKANAKKKPAEHMDDGYPRGHPLHRIKHDPNARIKESHTGPYVAHTHTDSGVLKEMTDERYYEERIELKTNQVTGRGVLYSQLQSDLLLYTERFQKELVNKPTYIVADGPNRHTWDFPRGPGRCGMEHDWNQNNNREPHAPFPIKFEIPLLASGKCKYCYSETNDMGFPSDYTVTDTKYGDSLEVDPMDRFPQTNPFSTADFPALGRLQYTRIMLPFNRDIAPWIFAKQFMDEFHNLSRDISVHNIDGNGSQASVGLACGNFFLEGGEECDYGLWNGLTIKCKYGVRRCLGCDFECRNSVEHGIAAYCGDGKINHPTEECDDGNDIAGDGCTDCRFDCLPSRGIRKTSSLGKPVPLTPPPYQTRYRQYYTSNYLRWQIHPGKQELSDEDLIAGNNIKSFPRNTDPGKHNPNVPSDDLICAYCLPGYQGLFCEKALCENGVVDTTHPELFCKLCFPGWTGSYCHLSICESNGGRMNAPVHGDSLAECAWCPDGTHGRYCEHKISEEQQISFLKKKTKHKKKQQERAKAKQREPVSIKIQLTSPVGETEPKLEKKQSEGPETQSNMPKEPEPEPVPTFSANPSKIARKKFKTVLKELCTTSQKGHSRPTDHFTEISSRILGIKVEFPAVAVPSRDISEEINQRESEIDSRRRELVALEEEIRKNKEEAGKIQQEIVERIERTKQLSIESPSKLDPAPSMEDVHKINPAIIRSEAEIIHSKMKVLRLQSMLQAAKEAANRKALESQSEIEEIEAEIEAIGNEIHDIMAIGNSGAHRTRGQGGGPKSSDLDEDSSVEILKIDPIPDPLPIRPPSSEIDHYLASLEEAIILSEVEESQRVDNEQPLLQFTPLPPLPPHVTPQPVTLPPIVQPVIPQPIIIEKPIIIERKVFEKPQPTVYIPPTQPPAIYNNPLPPLPSPFAYPLSQTHSVEARTSSASGVKVKKRKRKSKSASQRSKQAARESLEQLHPEEKEEDADRLVDLVEEFLHERGKKRKADSKPKFFSYLVPIGLVMSVLLPLILCCKSCRERRAGKKKGKKQQKIVYVE